MALIVAMLGAATFASCASAQREERFPTLVEGRDWFPAFTPTIEAAPKLAATPTVQELDPAPVAIVDEAVTQEAPRPTPPPVYLAGPLATQARALTESELESALRDAGWPDDLTGEAKRVAQCESHWHPGSVNSSSGVTGLFQLWSGWYRYAGLDVAQWADPVVNARAALAAYRYSDGWQQWACKP